MATVRGRRAGPVDWEVVWVGDGETVAAIIAGSLEAEGINTRTAGSRVAARAGAGFSTFSTWSVLVRASQAEQAREHLRETGEGTNVVSGGSVSGADVRALLRLTMYALAVLAVVVLLALIRSRV